MKPLGSTDSSVVGSTFVSLVKDTETPRFDDPCSESAVTAAVVMTGSTLFVRLRSRPGSRKVRLLPLSGVDADDCGVTDPPLLPSYLPPQVPTATWSDPAFMVASNGPPEEVRLGLERRPNPKRFLSMS